MKTRCSACGATSSLDALLGHSEASQAFVSSLSLLGDLQAPIVKYLALFRPQSRDLTFERAAKLLTEIAPDFVAKQIKRGHQTYPAPTGAWGWAIGVLLERRDQNKIDLPLKSHGYLYEVITSYKPYQHAVPESKSAETRPQLVVEKSMYERQQERKAHEQQKHEKPAFTFNELIAQANAKKSKPQVRTLKDIPPEQVFAHVAKNRRDGETHNECFERLLAQQEQGTTT